MTRLTAPLSRAVARLWAIDRPLTTASLFLLATLAVALAGLLVDDRLIGGMPAWMKPAKFAISTAIYGLTLVWIFGHLQAWARTRRVVSWLTAVIFLLEIAIIDLQAWRGTTSHFNIGTAFDAVLFAVMGTGIIVQTISMVAVAVALWRERFADRARGWTLRLGLTITIIGAASGGLMTRPTPAQLAEAEATHVMLVAGAHTVGAPDGGPGMPGTGWSREHGDLRVPHFIGLHAIQALPLIALLWRRRAEATRVRLAMVSAASYGTLFALLLWQALGGESVPQPSRATITAAVAWTLLSVTAIVGATFRPSVHAAHGHAL